MPSVDTIYITLCFIGPLVTFDFHYAPCDYFYLQTNPLVSGIYSLPPLLLIYSTPTFIKMESSCLVQMERGCQRWEEKSDLLLAIHFICKSRKYMKQAFDTKRMT